jgi:hypothetical protein
MPKINIDFDQGSAVSEEWRPFLVDRFGPNNLERLERLGGRLTVSLTVPFVPKGRRINGPKFDDDELALIRGLSKDKGALQGRLDQYDTKNLRLACERLGIAVSKKIPRVEMIAEIVRYLNSDAMWDAISRPQSGQI